MPTRARAPPQSRDRSSASTSTPTDFVELAEDEFQKVTASVYDELTYREMAALYCTLFPNAPAGTGSRNLCSSWRSHRGGGSDTEDWSLACRKRQAFECVTGGMPNSAPSFMSTPAVMAMPVAPAQAVAAAMAAAAASRAGKVRGGAVLAGAL